MTLFACTVLGKPIPQARMKHTKTGRGYYPEASKAHRETLVDAFSWQGRKPPPIEEACSLLIEIAGAHGASDLDNHGKQVCDALVSAGILAKDSIMVVRELVVRVVDGEARTVVTITAWQK